ncbi:hypothetical protein [Alteromonas sp. ASW11-130]|uniref:hypothetical protein n=1 Tax=Alteromonas sp. ASW11-130 TaxID=3015775 RepID=UPI002242A5C9|nr:hypothetical protein [Alteromonas sp. ASW11-130]MCW8090918.1 hypothetical protein [Alteromonas sp. ASW11-130]
MSLSYREKSLWLSLLVELILASYFGRQMLALLNTGAAVDPTAMAALLLKIVISFVIVEAVLHSLLAMKNQEGAGEPEDERENAFRLKANEIGYWFLSVGLIVCIVHELVNKQLAESAITHSVYQSFSFAPLELKLVVVFWLSEVLRFSSQLYFYRKG